MRTWGLAWALLAVALAGAGCASQGAPSTDALADGAPRLQASDTTGVLRGIVVDEAIRPLANVSVKVTGDGVQREAYTAADGFFGFAALPPGTYFVTASRVAYGETQQSVDVLAGVSEPPLVRMQLTLVPGDLPFVTALHAEAFVQCIVPGANLCAIVNLYPCALAGMCDPLLPDTSYVTVFDEVVSLQRVPDWFQTEVVWDSTQAISPDLGILSSAHEPADGAGRDERQAAASGASPLLLPINATMAAEWDLGTMKGVAYEIFGHMAATAAIGSAGIVLNQQVDFFTHVFYGYTPPEGWRITEGPVPPPPQ